MYSRAPRKLHDDRTTTGTAVGPGSYAGDTRIAPPKPVTFAPFGTMRDRETLFAQSQLAKPVPGPNTYAQQSSTHIVGASTLSNRSRRFDKDETRAPPPNTYNIATSLKGQQKQRKTTTMSINKPPAASRVQFVRKSTAATIPARFETAGYVVGPDGTLHKAKARVGSGRRLGPGTYDVTRPEEHSATAKYKGAGWGKRTGRRQLPFESDKRRHSNPSPFEYTTAVNASAARETASVSPRAVRPPFQTTARRDVAASPRASKDAVPTPMSYAIPSSFSATKSPKPKHFGSTSERFRDDKPRAPAPGTYTDPRTAITVRQTSGLSGLPFQQTAPRFEEPHIIRETPAPIEYSVSMPAASKGATSAFHSTARRTEPMFKRDTFMTPSPFDYQREEDTTGATFKSGEKQNYHAAFGVRARRFGDSECDIHVPPPTKYDVSGEQKHRPEGVPKSQPHPAFRSRTKRTQLPVTNTDTPPPNSYNPSPPKKQGGGRLADHERERFRVRVSDAPPPTSYSPHPAVADSMYKVVLT